MARKVNSWEATFGAKRRAIDRAILKEAERVDGQEEIRKQLAILSKSSLDAIESALDPAQQWDY